MNKKDTGRKLAGPFFDKKGLGVAQVFVFMIAAITFSLVLIFGYRAISGFLDTGEQVGFVQFKSELESSIKGIYTEYGSVRIKEYTVPTEYRKICFVDLNTAYPEGSCDVGALGCSVWKDASDRAASEGGDPYDYADENVFLDPPGEQGVQIKVYKIETMDNVDGGFHCETITNGFFRLYLEGLGDRTGVASAE